MKATRIKNYKIVLTIITFVSLLAFPKTNYATVNEVDPSLSPPPMDSASGARNGSKNALSPAFISANIGVIAAVVVLALANSSDAHTHAHFH